MADALDPFVSLFRAELRAVLREELAALRDGPPPPPASVVALTVDDVAKRCRVSRPTVRAWIHSGRLPASKPGHGYLVKPADLDAFLVAKRAALRVVGVDEAVGEVMSRIGALR